MKKFYTVLGLSPKDPQSKYVDEFGKEYPKCTEKVYFPITPYISSVIEEGEKFILYAIDSGQNEHTLRKKGLLEEELNKYYPGQVDFRYLEANLEQDTKGQVSTFKTLYETFVEDENEHYDVYFDFTFGYRPTPMTIFVACNYADKFLKNVKIKNLIYSQFNHANPNGAQPIIDITSLYLLNNLIDTLSMMNSSKPMEFIDKVFKL
ncbi:MAG: TM1812 family CRISPR-associated protein [Bacillota bacterium]|nr:TM1812 family CRISPR-associated protein [Bacillota bacterium]